MLAQVPKTRWGGVADGCFRPSGYFRVAQRDGVFWLVDPDGGRFLSKGVNTVQVRSGPDSKQRTHPICGSLPAKYGSQAAWRTAVAARLAGWGFNTLGTWSDEAVANAGSVPLAVTSNLDLGMSFAWPKTTDKTSPGRISPMSSTRTSIAMSAAGRSNCAKEAASRASSAGSSTMNCAGDRIGAALTNY